VNQIKHSINMNYPFISIITGKLPEALETQGAFRLPEFPSNKDPQLVTSKLVETISKIFLNCLVKKAIVPTSLLIHFVNKKYLVNTIPDYNELHSTSANSC